MMQIEYDVRLCRLAGYDAARPAIFSILRLRRLTLISLPLSNTRSHPAAAATGARTL